jgi:uncharacterized protein
MDTRFVLNNTHLRASGNFAETDPHLERLYSENWVHYSSIIDAIPRHEPGIVTLGGGRQIGKTTLLKQWMESLLKQGVMPQSICFFSGELISDHQSLFNILSNQLAEMPAQPMKYLILDEITDITDWDKTVKYLVDVGLLKNTLLVLSGSDLVLVQDARKRFPGRRGKAAVVDFHYYPLSFREYLLLKNCLPEDLSERSEELSVVLPKLYEEFDRYLVHGGFLSAINEFETYGRIRPATLITYSDWIRGDVLKRNKKEHFLYEIIEAIETHYLNQISWTNLVQALSIDHVQTVLDYIDLLCSMDVVFVQPALVEDKLKPAPKKRKKLMFADPFIYHALRAWLTPCDDPYDSQIKPAIADSMVSSNLVEACVTTHFRRFFPTYYIKSVGEVDIAYVHNNKFWPVEVKWSNQLRPHTLKQVQKYKNSTIYAKTDNFSVTQPDTCGTTTVGVASG